jgi:tellurite resistance protein TehA-like permease
LTFLSIPFIYWFAGLALVLPRIPVIGKWFNIINTAIHELGHALMALILEGNVKKLNYLTTLPELRLPLQKQNLAVF